MASKNAIIGYESLGIDLPETQVDEQDLTAEKNAAKFSRTKEFQALKTHLENRIAFYQTYLPNQDIAAYTDKYSVSELGARWIVASNIIAELQAIIATYEQAAAALKQHRPE